MIDTHFLHFQEFDITGNDFNPNHFAMNGKKRSSKECKISGFYIEKVPRPVAGNI